MICVLEQYNVAASSLSGDHDGLVDTFSVPPVFSLTIVMFDQIPTFLWIFSLRIQTQMQTMHSLKDHPERHLRKSRFPACAPPRWGHK